jgi:hypothetical protein
MDPVPGLIPRRLIRTVRSILWPRTSPALHCPSGHAATSSRSPAPPDMPLPRTGATRAPRTR